VYGARLLRPSNCILFRANATSCEDVSYLVLFGVYFEPNLFRKVPRICDFRNVWQDQVPEKSNWKGDDPIYEEKPGVKLQYA
jgi:hypothetical protein